MQLARDAVFARFELDEVVPGSGLNLPDPAPGIYFVRTQVVLPDGSSGPWSAVQQFEVPSPPPPPPPAKPFPWPLLMILLLPFL